MVRKRKTVITNNREIYEKFSMLNFSSEILLKDVKKLQVDRIIKNINNGGCVLTSEKVGDYIVVKRVGPVNFNIYFK